MNICTKVHGNWGVKVSNIAVLTAMLLAQLHKSPNSYKSIYVTPSTGVKSCIKICYVLTALVEYKNISKKTLQQSIESEMSGNLEDLLVAVGEKNVLHSV